MKKKSPVEEQMIQRLTEYPKDYINNEIRIQQQKKSQIKDKQLQVTILQVTIFTQLLRSGRI